FRAFSVLPQVVSGDSVGFVVMEIPYEAVQALFGLDLFFWFLVVGIQRFVQRLAFIAGVTTDYAAGCVEDFNFHFFFVFFIRFIRWLWGLLQIVVNDRAVGRILSGEGQ